MTGVQTCALPIYGGNSYGASWGDYDGDGDPDVYVSNYGQPNSLYSNEGVTAGWLSVELVPTASAPNGSGARVIAVAGGQRQTRTTDGGGGSMFGSQSVGPVLFGFGPTTATIDSLIVEWPSGAVTERVGVVPGDTLIASEPEALYALTGEEIGRAHV